MFRVFLNLSGVVSLGMGIIGIFVPILPTTPFLLLAASCFYRSSPKHYEWLLSHPRFGPPIRSYRTLKAIPLKAKVFSLVALWLSVGSVTLSVARHWTLALILLLIATCVTIHILTLKTLTREMALENAHIDEENRKPRKIETTT